jgi:UDP-N-acetylmuramate--alanine ligase
MAEFAGAFGDADTVQVLDIYAASEEPIAGVTAEALVQEIGRGGVDYAGSVGDGVAALVKEARDGDVVLTLGAGSVSSAGGRLLEGLAGSVPFEAISRVN